MKTFYSHPNVHRNAQQTSFFDGLHPESRGNSVPVFNLIASYEHPSEGRQVDVVAQTFSDEIRQAWLQAGELPLERTEDYVPVLTKSHIFPSSQTLPQQRLAA